MSQEKISKMNKILFLWVLPLAVVFFVVFALIIFRAPPEQRILFEFPEESQYEDGTYRGTFADLADIQISLQFTLKDGIVTEAAFRHLKRDENYHLDSVTEPYRSVVKQYKELLEYLVGKNLRETLPELYYPARIIHTEVDGYTAATVRSSKIISAIRDALNRGVYRY
jgi:uncharacterized protein with FMN-binding domain